jgi:hypothetical protein
MRQFPLVGIISCALTIFATGSASALDAIELYRSCHSTARSMGDFGCIAYIHGFLDGMAAGHAAAEILQGKFCPPKEGVSVDQGRLIVEKYMRDHPGQLNREAGLIVASAMYDAFSCRTSN